MRMTNNKPSENKKQAERMTKTAKIAVLIGSFLGAIVLWIYAIGYDSTLFDNTYNGVLVVVEGENQLVEEKGYTLAEGQDFSSITVVAKGKRADLNALDASDFKAVVDVSKAEGAGWQTLPIEVISPNGIEIISQSSTTVRVFVDEFTQINDLLTVKVEAEEKGYRLATGVTNAIFTTNPVAVTVAGPKSVLDTISDACVSFDLEGYEITDNFRGYGAIYLRDAKGNVINNEYVTLSDSTAEVTVTVTKEKTLPISVSFNGGKLLNGITVEPPSPGAITVFGSPEAIASLGNELVLTVDETSLEPGKTTEIQFPIVEMLPKGISSENSGNITVKVTMPSLSMVEYDIPAESISVVNLPEGYDYKITNGIKVKVIGPADAFENFDHTLMTATVDYNDITFDGSDIQPMAEPRTGEDPDNPSQVVVVKYTSNASIDLGGDHPALYVLNVEYKVNFSVTPIITPEVIPAT